MSQDLVGTEIGGYSILQQIGEGGNGVVYRAMHTKTKQPVAIKILLDLKSQASSANRFFEEARAIRQINHPNIVEIYELQSLPDGRPYMVMELLQGEDLEKYLKVRRRLHAVEALEICMPVAEALDAAHQKGIIHRDLKPDNIFLVKSGASRQIKLLDFGIAKFRGPEGTARITQSGMLLGTPHYMSPEQANQPKSVDGRSDLYALGVILYEMVTGKPPFDSDTPIAVLFLHFDKAPTPPSKHVPGLSSKLEGLILRCLSKTPAGRPASAHAFLQDCKDILKYERIEALKKTKAAPENLLQRLKALEPAETTRPDDEPKVKDLEEDEVTSIAPMSEELEEVLSLDDAIEVEEDEPPGQTQELERGYTDLSTGVDPTKTTEDLGIKPFSREALGLQIRGSQELTQPKTNQSQELAKLILARRPADQKTPEPKAAPKPLEQKPEPASTRIATKPTANKPNAEEPPKAKPTPKPMEDPTKTKPVGSPPETKIAIPRPSKALVKTQKSLQPPAFLEDDSATAKQKSPSPKTIQAYAQPEEPRGPSTLLMTEPPDEATHSGTLLMEPVEEPVRLRLRVSPADAQVFFWINESGHRPESPPAEIFAAKKSIIEIAVVARGFLPKQATFFATQDLEVSIVLERPGPRAPLASKAPPTSGTKR